MIRHSALFATAALAALVSSGTAQAVVTVFPQASLTPSTDYYTDRIGGGLGTSIVTTGGGNAANVGALDGRNDDGFQGPIDLTTFGFSPGFTFFGGPGYLAFPQQQRQRQLRRRDFGIHSDWTAGGLGTDHLAFFRRCGYTQRGEWRRLLP